MRKKLPIGIDGFGKLRTNDFYYVDKTGFIADLLRDWGEVNLFTRPRRFGKTLNMSMLKCFFEIGTDKSLFDGLKIAEDKAVRGIPGAVPGDLYQPEKCGRPDLCIRCGCAAHFGRK